MQQLSQPLSGGPVLREQRILAKVDRCLAEAKRLLATLELKRGSILLVLPGRDQVAL